MNSSGRPSKYSEALAEEICARLVNGKDESGPESLRAICRDDAMPSIGTVMRWIAENPIFREQYARAKQEQADAIAEEMFEIADDGRNDWIERMDRNGEPTGTYMLNGEAVARSRLRVDQRKWYLSKLAPKKYGEKIDVEHSGDVDIHVVIGGSAKTE